MSVDVTNQLNNSNTPVILQAGSYIISSNVTTNTDITLDIGASITVPSGLTLKFQRNLAAPNEKIFDGAGTVDMNHSEVLFALPEWWGARPNDGSFDCLPSLQAAVAAHPVVKLAAADYYISDTWKVQLGSRAIEGSGSRWSPSVQGTRIVVVSNSADVMQVGTDAMPNSINSFVTRVAVSRVGLWRTTAPAKPSASNLVVGATGLRAQYLLDCIFDDVWSGENIVGFHVSGVVFSHFKKCAAFRSSAATGTGPDSFHGFYLNGNVFPAGAAGGNASVYLTDCSASTGGPQIAGTTIGMGLDGAFADTFVTRFETVGINKGIMAFGSALLLDPARRRVGNANLHFNLPILDQCTDRCIEIGNMSDYAAIEIVDPYLSPAVGALAAIHVHDGGGNVHINGGQMLGFLDADAAGNCVGILAERQTGLRVTGAKIIGCRRPVVLDTCSAFDIAPDISNPAEAASQAAIYLANCTRGRINPFVRGSAGRFPQGINLTGAGNTKISIDFTGVDPGAITGGAGNKLLINGVQITTIGAKGTNYVYGSPS